MGFSSRVHTRLQVECDYWKMRVHWWICGEQSAAVRYEIILKNFLNLNSSDKYQ